jgi:phage terminase small subunit
MANELTPETTERTDGKLNLRQQMFCLEYVIDFNGTKAAERAGYSQDTAAEQASRLLTNVKISDEVARLMDDKISRAKATADTVLANIYKISEVDVGDAFDENGALLAIRQIPKDLRKIISSIETFEEFAEVGGKKVLVGYTRKVKLWSKDKALELLAKHHKLITEKHEVAGADGKDLTLKVIFEESEKTTPNGNTSN